MKMDHFDYLEAKALTQRPQFVRERPPFVNKMKKSSLTGPVTTSRSTQTGKTT